MTEEAAVQIRNIVSRKLNDELGTSFPEQAIYYHLYQQDNTIENRALFDVWEADIWIPAKKIVIEYDGSYYHSLKTAVERDNKKNIFFAESGIRLIRVKDTSEHVLEHWNNDHSILYYHPDNNYMNLGVVISMLIKEIFSKEVSIEINHIEIYNRYIELRKEHSLQALYPEIAKEWHPTKNKNITPDLVLPRSGRMFWWVCNNGHEWRVSVAHRTQGNKCPYCSNKRLLKGYNDLATTHPELAAEWHPTKNGDLTPDEVIRGSGKYVWWRCKDNPLHEWRARISERIRGSNCPICLNQKVLKGHNDLATLYPDIAAEWHPTKNGELTPDKVSAGGRNPVWWQCKKNPKHEWQATIAKRTKNHRGCPYCTHVRLDSGINDLATTHPELAAEWHPTKNGDLKPEMVATYSNKKVWWQCKNNPKHEWQATIAKRTKNHRGCPYCVNQKILKGDNDLATTHPDIAAEWHPTKNGKKKPDEIVAGSNNKYWWKCSVCGHEWEAVVYNRTKKGTGCPQCRKNKRKSMRDKEGL